MVWALVGRLGELVGGPNPSETTRSLLQEWGLDRQLTRLWAAQGLAPPEAGHRTALIQVQGLLELPDLEKMLGHPEVRHLAGVNAYQGTVWIDKGGVESLVWSVSTRRALALLARAGRKTPNALAKLVAPVVAQAEAWLILALKSGYRFEAFLAGLEPKVSPASRPKKPKITRLKPSP